MMKTVWMVAVAVGSVFLPALAADDFQWSFQEGGKAPAPAAATNAVRGGITADAYNDLLKENLKLRKDLDAVAQDGESARKEKDALTRQVQDLETKIRQSSSRIEDLNRQKAAANPDRVVELETQLAAAEAEKAKLARDLDGARSSTPAAAAAAVQPGSDLYRKLEQENMELKQKLAAAAAVPAPAPAPAADVAGDAELRARLAQAEAEKEQQRQVIEKLTRQIPELESRIRAVQSAGDSAPSASSSGDAQQLETMRLELERREQRLLKAERILELIERARGDLKVSSDREKRDMHYNMATMYAKEGRYPEAEQEYLHALRMDPADADTHYNLALLYDTAMGDRRRAAMHYRKYLQLSPNAPDANAVETWLQEAETKR